MRKSKGYDDEGRAQSSKPSALESFAAGASALSKLTTRSSLEAAAFERGDDRGASDDENGRLALDRSARSRGDRDGRSSYTKHYTGLQAYGDSGLTKLEELIDAAIQARDNAPHTGPVKYGAAVLSKKGEIFSGCNVESASNSGKSLFIYAYADFFWLAVGGRT